MAWGLRSQKLHDDWWRQPRAARSLRWQLVPHAEPADAAEPLGEALGHVFGGLAVTARVILDVVVVVVRLLHVVAHLADRVEPRLKSRIDHGIQPRRTEAEGQHRGGHKARGDLGALDVLDAVIGRDGGGRNAEHRQRQEVEERGQGDHGVEDTHLCGPLVTIGVAHGAPGLDKERHVQEEDDLPGPALIKVQRRAPVVEEVRMDLAGDGGEDAAADHAENHAPLHELRRRVEERPAFGCQELQQSQRGLRDANPDLPHDLERADAPAVHHVDRIVEREARLAGRGAQRREQQQPQQRPRAQRLGSCGVFGHRAQSPGVQQEEQRRQEVQPQAAQLVHAELALHALLHVHRVDLVRDGLRDRHAAGNEGKVPEARL
mmetsp:Transcript_40067/g.103734  ORF Transcript_40067/g.103734 Transcript_40067/m.103734 type:complete len:376 (+) Transcript_40067:53-1180(+)